MDLQDAREDVVDLNMDQQLDTAELTLEMGGEETGVDPKISDLYLTIYI